MSTEGKFSSMLTSLKETLRPLMSVAIVTGSMLVVGYFASTVWNVSTMRPIEGTITSQNPTQDRNMCNAEQYKPDPCTFRVIHTEEGEYRNVSFKGVSILGFDPLRWLKSDTETIDKEVTLLAGQKIGTWVYDARLPYYNRFANFTDTPVKAEEFGYETKFWTTVGVKATAVGAILFGIFLAARLGGMSFWKLTGLTLVQVAAYSWAYVAHGPIITAIIAATIATIVAYWANEARKAWKTNQKPETVES
jgi:hypothetical protein